ncbi:GGDEF domain-containing protein [Neisseriaceae bacterium TC5R-5]|nr:GGDEF domain-containing protein [Neisseriaceae bacterium TC5R-5]
MLFGLATAFITLLVRIIQAIESPETVHLIAIPSPLTSSLLLANIASLLIANVAWLMFQQDRTKAAYLKLANEDPLTGLANRHLLFRTAPQTLTTAKQTNAPLSLLLLDLDYFKQINDTWGHDTGDLALKHFANMLRASIRPNDLAVRYGGEEFCVLIAAEPQAAQHIAQRLAEKLREQSNLPAGQLIQFSGGIASTINGSTTLEQLISRADQALYLAKNQGRNQVQLEQTEGVPPLANNVDTTN